MRVFLAFAACHIPDEAFEFINGNSA